jgi:hypothetical protein
MNNDQTSRSCVLETGINLSQPMSRSRTREVLVNNNPETIKKIFQEDNRKVKMLLETDNS